MGQNVVCRRQHAGVEREDHGMAIGAGRARNRGNHLGRNRRQPPNCRRESSVFSEKLKLVRSRTVCKENGT